MNLNYILSNKLIAYHINSNNIQYHKTYSYMTKLK